MATLRFQLGEAGGDRPRVIVLLRLSNRSRLQYVTSIRAFRAWWSDKKQRHASTFIPPPFMPEVRQIDGELAELRTRILARVAEVPREVINRQWLANEVTRTPAAGQGTPRTLTQAIRAVVDSARDRTRDGKQLSEATVIKYAQFSAIIARWLRKRRLTDIPLPDVDGAFYDDLFRFFCEEGLKPNYFGCHIKILKAVLHTLPPETQARIPLLHDKRCVTVKQKADSVYLSEKELEQLRAAELPPRDAMIRDQFLLLAWTGCRYSDYGQINGAHIREDGGDLYLYIRQQKTGADVVIPVLPVTGEILARYDYNPPGIYASQKFNKCLQKVCAKAGITQRVVVNVTSGDGRGSMVRSAVMKQKAELVTAHTARRSFATNMYKRGMPTLAIMAITGHTTEASFLAYIKVTRAEQAALLLRRFRDE